MGGVTIREKLNATRRRIILLGLAGGMLVLLGVAAATTHDGALLLAIAGSLVFFVAVFQQFAGVRCPRCGAGLGYALSWPPGRWLNISEKIRRCQFCGVSLDEEIEGRGGRG